MKRKSTFSSLSNTTTSSKDPFEIDNPNNRVIEGFQVENLYSIRIKSYDLVMEESDKYHVYWIEVQTKGSTYKLPRRYKEFYELYCFLKGNRGIDFDGFPKKTFWRLTRPNNLDKRMEQLDSYFQFLFERLNDSFIPELLEFLEIKQFTTMVEDDYLKNLPTTNGKDKILLTFLWRFNFEDSDRLKTLKEMERYCLDHRPKFSTKYLSLFLFGDEHVSGFIELCGKNNGNTHLVCSAGLKLLEKIMKPNMTRNSNEILLMFTTLAVSDLEDLELEEHLNCKKSCHKSSLALLTLYMRYNPSYDESLLIYDPSLRDTFNKWRKMNQFNSVIVENYSQIKENLWSNNSNSPGGLVLKSVFSSDKKDVQSTSI